MRHLRRSRAWPLALLGVAALSLPVGSAAAKHKKESAKRADHIREHYTKFEARIPMRDGVKLFTAIYVPNDRTKRHPLMIYRTPYRVAPYGVDRYARWIGPSARLERSGYIFVHQDVRGRFMSEGRFDNMRPQLPKGAGPKAVDESTDAYDTIAWLLKRLRGRHNGKAGMWGISYPGFYAAAGAINGHPALVAVSPQAPIGDWFFDDVHRHGAFCLSLTFNFFSRFGVKRPRLTAEWPDAFSYRTPDGYDFFLQAGPLSNIERRHFKGKVPFWQTIARHPNYDAFWRRRNLLPHLRGVKAAVLVVGGWYDGEDLYGTLASYRAIERQNRRADNRLVMGPWSHGAWRRGDGRKLADARFGSRTARHYREAIEARFFEHHLKGKKKWDRFEARVFETGANRWRRFSRWPPRRRRLRNLYLRAGGKLSFEAPKAAGVHESFVSDPHKPVPYTMQITTYWSKRFLAEDQRFAAWRPDVVVHATEPLKEDLTVAGPVDARLFVSTSQTAADWVVKLIDVHPGQRAGDGKRSVWKRFGGQQLLVRAEAFRGRFRDSYSQPKPFTPHKVTQVTFPLQDVLHTFKRGHRLMVHVQSSYFPLIDRNPQRYVPNIFEAKAGDFVKAEHRIYRSRRYPTHLVIGQLQAGP